MLLDDFLKHKQVYMDVVGLKWDIHFFPQALYCGGLYSRAIQDYRYNYVGTRLISSRLGAQYGEPATQLKSLREIQDAV